MFSFEHIKKPLGTLALMLVALAIHQKFIAPYLASKPKAPAVKL